MLDLLTVSEGFETEINDLNTFTTRVEKLGTDVGSKSSCPPLLLWLKADRLSAPGWARCARGREDETLGGVPGGAGKAFPRLGSGARLHPQLGSIR